MKLKIESKLVLLLGLISIILLSCSHISWRDLVKVNVPHIDNIIQTQVELSDAHLWFEELISGDTSIEIDEIWQGLDRADLLIQQILQGGKTNSGLDVIAIDNSGLKAELIKLQSIISEFRLIARQRWENKSESQVGSELDQRFDDRYKQAILLASKIDNDIHHNLSVGLREQDVIHVIILLIWVIIFISFTKRINTAVARRDSVQKELISQRDRLEESVSERTVELRLKAQELEFKNKTLHDEIAIRKESEHQLRIAATVFESQEGMIVTDANNVILRVNNAFTVITGYAAAEAVGQNPRMLSSGRQDKTFFSEMWKSINNTGTWEGEIWNRRKSGEIYPEHLNITAVKNAHGIITNYVATLTDISMNKAALEEIKNLAFYDPLTHLPNRRLLLDRLNQALATNTRSNNYGALLFLDLDHFKTLNDTLGHDIGDLLLQQVAERLAACVREGDTIARIGGDEFVVLLENLSTQDIEAAAQIEMIGNKIQTSFSQPFRLAAYEHNSTASIGATMFVGHQFKAAELLKQADIAMYEAKHAGRNALRFFDPMMQQVINVRANMERELHNAIEQQQFSLYYQIQVDSAGQVLGAEALIRWHHPERGMISPSLFIPLAEETEMIVPIGQWVLDAACAQLKLWQLATHTKQLTLSINVSAKQFRQAGFVAQVQTTIKTHAINPMLLKMELTEGMLLDNVDNTIATMNALRHIGITFSLDDFGTGYSSLQYLKRLPLYQLKIDQSFVRDIANSVSDQAIVRTIIAMAHTLNLNVIAEGVETEEQRQFLLSACCHTYQGYLFSKPVPIHEFETLCKLG
jgi:diguanylate cyclase (GGDEF)-like protein/PAS domain S-box-containing protein